MEHNADWLILIDRWPEGLGVLRLLKTDVSGLIRVSPAVFFRGMLQREFGVSKVKPTVSIATSTSDTASEVVKLANALSDFLTLPIMEENTAHRAEGTIMHISRNSRGKTEATFMTQPGHVEAGPRIIVSKLEWSKKG